MKKGPKTEDRRPKEKSAAKGSASAKEFRSSVLGLRSSAPHAEGKWAEWFTRKAGEKRYWLVKSEPEVFSFDDLVLAPKRTTMWDGVRNFAARNFLRDGMKLGDQVFYYHSMANPQAIVGICEVVKEGYPDPTAFDKKSYGYDADSKQDDPQWFAVDLRAVDQLPRPVTLPEIKARKELADMALVRIGRLSVTPVRDTEWKVILGMAK
ncbi:MAG: EVE domain-containing protein [Gemmatimonadaceae bacterium]